MTLPGFGAEAAVSAPSVFFRMRTVYANRSSYAVTMQQQCCPPGSSPTGCRPNTPPDCSTIRCPSGLVCCDCTVTHCTTPAQCRRECSL
jgi:hypothetical protein